MIYISRLPSGGLLIQRDATEISIDHAAVALALPGIIASLIDAGHAAQQAYATGHADGLQEGYERAEREQTVRECKDAEMTWGLAATLAA